MRPPAFYATEEGIKSYGEVKKALYKACFSTFNSYGLPFRPSWMQRKLHLSLKSGGIEYAVGFIQDEIARQMRSSRSDVKTVIRAMSLECRDNPYVSDYLRSVSGGLPGTGRR